MIHITLEANQKLIPRLTTSQRCTQSIIGDNDDLSCHFYNLGSRRDVIYTMVVYVFHLRYRDP